MKINTQQIINTSMEDQRWDSSKKKILTKKYLDGKISS